MRCLVLLAVIVMGSGCKSYMTVTPVNVGSVSYAEGRPIVSNAGAESSIVVTPSKRQWIEGSEMGFYISLANYSAQTLVVDSSNVTASGSESELRVWSYRDRIKKVQRQARMAAASAAFGALNDGMNQQTTTTTGHASAYGNSASYQETSTTSGFTQADLDRRNRERVAAMAAQTRSATEEAELILDKTSLQPGAVVDGFILVDAPKDPGPVILHVRVGADLHEIEFAYAEL